MNLNCYQYVISIAENASISKAAKELFITQPALTKYLNKLEADLGVRLFRPLHQPASNHLCWGIICSRRA